MTNVTEYPIYKERMTKTERHPLETDFIVNKIRQGDHKNIEKDYGEMGRLETKQENKNFSKWADNAFKD